MTVVAGVDGCRGGWVAVVLEDGQFADSLFDTAFAELLRRSPIRQPLASTSPSGSPAKGAYAPPTLSLARSSVPGGTASFQLRHLWRWARRPMPRLANSSPRCPRSHSPSERRSSRSRPPSRSGCSRCIPRCRLPRWPADISNTRSAAGTATWTGDGYSAQPESRCRTS
jgi:hypothetical protein